MTSNEIMVGDWVAFRGHPYRYTANDIATMAECEAKGIPTDTTQIPITPEILEKNGFIESGYERMACVTDEFCFALQKGVDGKNYWWWEMFDSPIIPLNFVHELQHALRLCNIDKEIVL